MLQSNADTGVFPSDAQAIYDALGSADKHMEMIDGDHYLQAPDTARDGVADMIADWVKSRI